MFGEEGDAEVDPGDVNGGDSDYPGDTSIDYPENTSTEAVNNNNNNVHLSCAHQRPQCSHHAY